MFESSLSEAQIKDSIKVAILEIFQEQRDLFQDLIAEALEDVASVQAIDEGRDSEPVSREVIFEILEAGKGGIGLG